jgi:transposase
MHHIQGQSRFQTTLFPESIDELIPKDHPVRVIDAFVEAQELAALGFRRVFPEATGRPPYHPGDLLKLYVYGYLNQVRSSRRLEREAARNIELMWLLNRLTPDFKTIADFRKDNGAAIQAVCRSFVLFCREQALFAAELVAIDGSRFGAVNSLRRNYTAGGLQRLIAETEQHIATYLQSLAEADADEGQSAAAGGRENTRQALARLQATRAELHACQRHMQANGEQQVSLTDADARLMPSRTQGHRVGYNVQTAVDSQHRLIVHHQVTNEVTDRNQLHPMAVAARRALAVEQLEVVADKGYSNGAALARCEADGITPYVPRQHTVNNQGAYFDKQAFHYDVATDSYHCPAGQVLRYRSRSLKKKKRCYAGDSCAHCALKPRCTDATRRWVTRLFDEDILEATERRAHAAPQIMRQRRAIVEHPFGTIKQMMGDARFLTKGLHAVATEMALSVLSYNLMRVINILGARQLMTRLAT